MMINGAAFPSKGEVEAQLRLVSHNTQPAPPSFFSSGDAPEPSITLEPDVPLGLGSFNGKPVEMRILPDGGYEWNGQPRTPTTGAARVTIEDLLAARASSLFSREEHRMITAVLGVIRGLYLLTRGLWSIELLNAYLTEFASPGAARDGVRRLGLDPDQPFAINGQPLRLLGDRFARWAIDG